MTATNVTGIMISVMFVTVIVTKVIMMVMMTMTVVKNCQNNEQKCTIRRLGIVQEQKQKNKRFHLPCMECFLSTSNACKHQNASSSSIYIRNSAAI